MYVFTALEFTTYNFDFHILNLHSLFELEIQGRGFNFQPEALELHFSQLVLVGS